MTASKMAQDKAQTEELKTLKKESNSRKSWSKRDTSLKNSERDLLLLKKKTMPCNKKWLNSNRCNNSRCERKKLERIWIFFTIIRNDYNIKIDRAIILFFI